MPLGAIRSVYTVANDMDLMQAFYEEALELPRAFRDRDKWCQFKAGQVPFALSSPSEAAKGARGSVIVFDANDVAVFVQRIERLGGRHLSSRDMGSHGSVVRGPREQSVSTACPARRLSLAEPQQVDPQQG
jgi:predicted enzyme related to lactoylglutathione lyase